jgi:hypothetical protein
MAVLQTARAISGDKFDIPGENGFNAGRIIVGDAEENVTRFRSSDIPSLFKQIATVGSRIEATAADNR